MTRSKKEYGIGFWFMRDFNMSLLAKQWQEIMADDKSMFFRIMKEKYFPNSTIWEARKVYQPSYSWSSILGPMVDEGRL